MNTPNNARKTEPHIFKTIRNDFRKSRVREEFRTEYKDLKHYFLTDESKHKLEGMSVFKRFFLLPWWLIKALYFRLTPFRRILFFIGCVGFFTLGNFNSSSDGTQFTINLSAVFTVLVFLFILALELKDKLLARTELEEGKAIQLALMPQQSPKVEGWDIWLFTKSANDVGGDLLDFIPFDERKYGIAVGDVAGKGLSAALLMAKLQSTIRALIYDYPSLKSLFNKLNTIFHRDSPAKIFASLIYTELHADSSIIKVINAGHYPPILIRSIGIEKLSKDAPALGLVSNAEFKEQQVTLERNDTIIIYSDGLTESQNDSGDFFGEENLMTLISNCQFYSASQLGNRIVDSVTEFMGKIPPHDDLTLAIIKKVS